MLNTLQHCVKEEKQSRTKRQGKIRAKIARRVHVKPCTDSTQSFTLFTTTLLGRRSVSGQSTENKRYLYFKADNVQPHTAFNRIKCHTFLFLSRSKAVSFCFVRHLFLQNSIEIVLARRPASEIQIFLGVLFLLVKQFFSIWSKLDKSVK